MKKKLLKVCVGRFSCVYAPSTSIPRLLSKKHIFYFITVLLRSTWNLSTVQICLIQKRTEMMRWIYAVSLAEEFKSTLLDFYAKKMQQHSGDRHLITVRCISGLSQVNLNSLNTIFGQVYILHKNRPFLTNFCAKPSGYTFSGYKLTRK